MNGGVDIDPELVASWLRARSVSRGLPQPITDRGGLRIDTDLPDEKRRYVFARPCEGLRELGLEISEPLILLKLCGTEQELRVMLPAKWEIITTSRMMVCNRAAIYAPAMPDDLTLEVYRNGDVSIAQIVDATGVVAAQGRAAEYAGVFCYDQIATSILYRRRGLGSLVMASLLSTRRSNSSQQILTATTDGYELYRSLGWRVYSPWMTAHLPN